MKKIILLLLCFTTWHLQAQTLTDGLFMSKKEICTGFTYTSDKWDHYWEGTLYRENKNIGTLTTQNVAWMANYGINDRLNVLCGLPYVWTKASAGTLAGQHGLQDFTLGLKWKALELKFPGGTLSGSLIAGGSVPVTNYVADFLPMSIGLQAPSLFGRGILRYEHQSKLSASLLAGYTLRNNITLDRTSYYTTSQHNTNEVAMPDMWQLSARAGYISYRWQAEVVYDQMTTIGGFDIRRNDMPFPSNTMNASRLGLAATYRIAPLADVQVVASSFYTLSGRNMGRSLIWTAGLMRIFRF